MIANITRDKKLCNAFFLLFYTLVLFNFALLRGIPVDARSFIDPPDLTEMHHCVFRNVMDRQ